MSAETALRRWTPTSSIQDANAALHDLAELAATDGSDDTDAALALVL